VDDLRIELGACPLQQLGHGHRRRAARSIRAVVCDRVSSVALRCARPEEYSSRKAAAYRRV
jgi:hypothetical protein